jgi:hypothetical protein
MVTRTIIENPDKPDELILELGEEICDPLGWKEGDILVWTDLGNGSWKITKKILPE